MLLSVLPQNPCCQVGKGLQLSGVRETTLAESLGLRVEDFSNVGFGAHEHCIFYGRAGVM